MRLGFAIPAHNEEQFLPATLAAIADAARGLDHVVVVADDASTDGTALVAQGAGAEVVPIRARQISAARNAAGRRALERGADVLLFVDADTRITPESLREALDLIESGCVGGGGTFVFDGPVPLYARVLLTLFQGLMHISRLSGGAFIFCTREAFLKAGGWDQTLFASEEIAFASALKKHGRFRIVRSPVVTSGRKLREFTAGEVLGVCLLAALSGGRTLRSRDRLGVWYGERARRNGPAPAHLPSSSDSSASAL
jgi:glycosyltransferase involved in cell wall biosynthesis